MTPLIDIGVNLTGRQFSQDVDAVIHDAVAADVTRMVVTGTSMRSSDAASALALRHPGVLWSTAGVHPHDAKSCDDATLPRLRELAAAPHVVALGECGLDFNRMFSPQPVQERWFEAQLELAAELGLPVFLHERDAHDRFVSILARWRDRLPGAVVHCFTGNETALRAYLDLDCHIGITGWICDERRGVGLREIVSLVPPDRLMVETDAPWLMPRDLGRGRNVPANLPHICGHVADCVGRSVDQVAAETTRTAERFFGL
jgi:TatD DNase family protein